MTTYEEAMIARGSGTPNFAEHFCRLWVLVDKRRELRKLDVSRLCQNIPSKVKNIIWRFLPSVREDEDRERMLWYVKQDHYDFGWASKEDQRISGRTDRPTNSPWQLFFGDREVMTACMIKHPQWLYIVSPKMQKNKEVVLPAVTNNGRSLKHAHESLRRDVDVVLAAVRNDGTALQYAHQFFLTDKAIILAAVRNCGLALECADVSMRKDYDIALAAVTQNPHSLRVAISSVPGGVMVSDNIVHYAVTLDGDTLRHAPYRFRGDVRTVLSAVSNYGHALSHADDPLRDDLMVVLRAVTTCWRAIAHASVRLKYHEEVKLIAARHSRLCKACRQDPQLTNATIQRDWVVYFPDRPLPLLWAPSPFDFNRI